MRRGFGTFSEKVWSCRRQLLFRHEGFGQAMAGSEFHQNLRSEAITGGCRRDVQAPQAVGEAVAGQPLRMIRAGKPFLETEFKNPDQ